MQPRARLQAATCRAPCAAGQSLGGSLLGVTASMVFSTTLPVTDTPVLTTAPVTEIAAPAAAPATLTTAQPGSTVNASASDAARVRPRGKKLVEFTGGLRGGAPRGGGNALLWCRIQCHNLCMADVTTPNIVELRHVHFGYGERPILSDVSLAVPRGKVIALMGASGGGKTTILRLIGRLWAAQQGEVLFDGRDVRGFDTAQLYAARRRMGMLFQFGALFPDLTVGDNVAFPLREHTTLSDAMIRDLVLMKLNAVGLAVRATSNRARSPAA